MPELPELFENTNESVPFLTYLKVQNYRVFKSLEINDLCPINIFIGRNGSGKSTLLDVFAFIKEAVETDVETAVEARGGFQELRSRGSEGAILVEFGICAAENAPIYTYRFVFDEILDENNNDGPEIAVLEEIYAITKERNPEIESDKIFFSIKLIEGNWELLENVSEIEIKNTLNRIINFTKNNNSTQLIVDILGDWIEEILLHTQILDWANYDLSENNSVDLRKGKRKRLSGDGRNLIAVLNHIRQYDSERFIKIINKMKKMVPAFEKIEVRESKEDKKMLLYTKDAPFDEPIPIAQVSDGTRELLAYFTLLSDPKPPALVAIEEPEKGIAPTILYAFGEEFRDLVANDAQVFITTHSPEFLNAFYPNEVWVLHRAADGYAQAVRADAIPGVKEDCETGARIGYLWRTGSLDI